MLIKVYVYQWEKSARDSFPILPVSFQAQQIMDFLLNCKRIGWTEITLVTTQEIHVLRLLRLVREEVDNLKLTTEELEFYFDSPDDREMVKILPTEDGDLAAQVPGGFFTARVPELF